MKKFANFIEIVYFCTVKAKGLDFFAPTTNQLATLIILYKV